MNRSRALHLSLVCATGLWACGGAGTGPASATSGDTTPSADQPTVTVQPDQAAVTPKATQQFLSTVSGTIDTGVTWQVVEQGGGTISAAGLYTAPAGTGTFHVRATSRASPTVQGTATVTVTTTPPPTSSVPTVGGCPVFTADDAWNTDVSGRAVDSNWTTRIRTLVGAINIHPDFGGSTYGIPINIVPQSQPLLPMSFDYADESDPGPYPFPGAGAVKIEGNDPTCASDEDCHVLAVQQGTCRVFEGYACRTSGSGWHCGSGARFDLTRSSQGQRPAGWTSADAAGLSILAGLIRYGEVAVDREIKHAIRFTLKCSQASYVFPASHYAATCAGNANAPPMGLRMRLAASYDVSGFSADTQVVLRAMKKYGIILADNGSDFYFQAETDARWSDTLISELKRVPASAFEAVAP